MAIYEIARRATDGHEGGYANNPADAGGETYKGIARKFHPQLDLWRWIDQTKAAMKAPTPETRADWTRRLNRDLALIPALQKAVDEFYRALYWDANKLTSIENQAVANWIYDHAVNAGSRGIKWAQMAAGVTADGIIGFQTIAAINTMPPDSFLQKAADIAAFYRLDRALANPSQIQFLPSWLRRDGITEAEIREVMAMAKNGLTPDEVKILKGRFEEVA